MSHEGSTMRNYVHEKIHKQVIEKLQTELAQLKEKCDDFEKVLKSIDTDTEIDDQGREWRMDKDDMRIISRNVLKKWKGNGC